VLGVQGCALLVGGMGSSAAKPGDDVLVAPPTVQAPGDLAMQAFLAEWSASPSATAATAEDGAGLDYPGGGTGDIGGDTGAALSDA
jgi:hypothetical protein